MERDRESGCSGGPHGEGIRPRVAGPQMPSQEPWTCFILLQPALLSALFSVPSTSQGAQLRTGSQGCPRCSQAWAPLWLPEPHQPLQRVLLRKAGKASEGWRRAEGKCRERFQLRKVTRGQAIGEPVDRV